MEKQQRKARAQYSDDFKARVLALLDMKYEALLEATPNKKARGEVYDLMREELEGAFGEQPGDHEGFRRLAGRLARKKNPAYLDKAFKKAYATTGGGVGPVLPAQVQNKL